MNLKENSKMALESIRSNKMRSLLTMLGIIIGISSVIMIISAGSGVRNQMMGEIESLGATTITVNVDKNNASANDFINASDIKAIQEKIPNVKAVSPNIQTRGALSKNGKQATAITFGTSHQAEQLSTGLDMVQGRIFNEYEYNSAQRVILIDDLAAKRLFGYAEVAGQTVDLSIAGKTVPFKIVGVNKSVMASYGMESDDMPAMVYIPATTLKYLSNEKFTLDTLYVAAYDKEQTGELANQVLALLQARHGNQGRSIYTAQDFMQQMEQLNTIISMFQIFLAAVAAISLLVGGIGVMNIMLVAVTERTREIGVRKSLGAKTNSILFQFLTESVVITLIGGAIGIVLGLLGATGICSLVGITADFNPVTIGFALAFSCAVGIFFGIYPARKAARLSPIEALRHE